MASLLNMQNALTDENDAQIMFYKIWIFIWKVLQLYHLCIVHLRVIFYWHLWIPFPTSDDGSSFSFNQILSMTDIFKQIERIYEALQMHFLASDEPTIT